jgi:hypothetical protein
MKRFIMAFAAIATIGLSGNAQIKTPAPSPSATINQTVGITDFKIEYARPGAKGRTIFGDLVPFGKVWRTGANKAVQFHTSTDIKIEGKELKKGHYAIFTIPNKDSWDIMWYTDTEIWGTPEKWEESKEACKVNVKTEDLGYYVESFTIAFDDVSNGNTGILAIKWEKTKVSIKIEVPTDEIAMESIETVMAGPSASDYYRAASYYLDAKKDLKKAHEWITKACEMRGEEAYWYFRKKSLIEAELGMFKEAIATAEISLKNAKEKGNQDYVKMNEESIEEWKKK